MDAYYNGNIFDGIQFHPHKALLVEDGRVIDLVQADDIPHHAFRKDLRTAFLVPSFIDLQIYGGHGKLFSQDLSVASLQSTLEYCRQGGASHFMITMATNAIDRFLQGIEVVKHYWQQGGQGLLGLHLEGPYISPQKRGAHLAEYVKEPTMDEIDLLLREGRDVIRMMTIAPEHGQDAILHRLRDAGIVLSAGHSNADYATATRAFDQGIPAATHLFNAMSPLQHRAPGMVGAILDHAHVMSSIVADGIHVDYPAIRIAKKLMGERLFVITDAVTETREGPYQHRLKQDHYVLPNGTLSGSALTMLKAVQNLSTHAGIALEESLRMASAYPAQLMQIDQGYLRRGSPAHFTIFNQEWNLLEMIG